MSDAERSVHLERRDRPGRCAYCHDPLADDVGVTCDGCGTRLHDDCVLEAPCPTLGCTHTFEAPAGGFRQREREGERRGWSPHDPTAPTSSMTPSRSASR